MVVEYDGAKAKCYWCGKTIYYNAAEDVYNHKDGRWEGDTGLLCHEGDYEHIATVWVEGEDDDEEKGNV